MTAGDAPGPDGEEAAVTLRAWAAAVDDAAGAIGAVLAALPGAWGDAAGREWTERLRLVGVELTRAADEAHGLARDEERVPATVVRLGGQTGARVTDRRGVVVPILPPP